MGAAGGACFVHTRSGVKGAARLSSRKAGSMQRLTDLNRAYYDGWTLPDLKKLLDDIGHGE